MYNAEILLDSINPSGIRLTTMRITFPRFILAEFNTHRVFSRNAASSRAISVKRRIQMVDEDPFIPEAFGKNQKGMQATEELDDDLSERAEYVWRRALEDAIGHAERLNNLGVHKQLANRILEPFCWVTVIVSSTEWDNFFTLRCSSLAQPEIKKIADLMQFEYQHNQPDRLQWGDWHSPLSPDKSVAVGRLARVSYESSGKSEDEDRKLCEQLKTSKHWSPFEHIAQASDQSGNRNFTRGWVQWRSQLDH